MGIRRSLIALVLFFVFVAIEQVVAETAKGAWMQAAPAPSKRTEVAAVALSGKVYVIGGFNRPSFSNVLDFAISRDVEVYDPVTDVWSAAAPLPEGRHHAGIAAIDGSLYVIGGFAKSGFSVWRPVNTVYQFNPATQIWRECAPMPTSRGALGVTVYQGRLYAIGGYDGERNTGVTEIYDPETDTWTSAASLSVPRDHLVVVTAGLGIYAIGGRSNLKYKQNTSVVEFYDPVADQWQYRTNLPAARSGIAAGVIDGHIYVLGGESGEGTFDTNEKYIPEENRWIAMAPMPTARHGLGVAVVEKRLYAIGGGPVPGASFSQLNEVYLPSK